MIQLTERDEVRDTEGGARTGGKGHRPSAGASHRGHRNRRRRAYFSSQNPQTRSSVPSNRPGDQGPSARASVRSGGPREPISGGVAATAAANLQRSRAVAVAGSGAAPGEDPFNFYADVPDLGYDFSAYPGTCLPTFDRLFTGIVAPRPAFVHAMATCKVTRTTRTPEDTFHGDDRSRLLERAQQVEKG